MPGSRELSRRLFLSSSSVLAATALLPGQARAALRPSTPGSPARSAARSLSLVNALTDERLSVVYWSQGRYEPTAISEVSFLLRDAHTGEIRPIDPRLLDLLHDVRQRLHVRAPYAVLSGYRSPETNAWLRQRDRRVARHSMHLDGRAADVRLPGVAARRLHEVALELGRGGVGFYPRREFVHLDTGPPRAW